MRSLPCRFSMSRRRVRSARTGLLLVATLLVASGCARGPSFPEITPEMRMAEVSFQREMALQSLRDSLLALDTRRQEIEELNQEREAVRDRLEEERSRLTAVNEQLAEANLRYDAMNSKLEGRSTEYEKLEVTYGRLRQMAQSTLEEVTALRQRNVNLEREKEQVQELVASREKEIARLSSELDDLRSELLRRATGEEPEVASVRPLPRSGPVGGAARGEAPSRRSAPASAEAGETADSEGPARPGDLDLETLSRELLALLKRRYDRAVRGEMAWDNLDFVLVSATAATLLCLMGSLYLLVRNRRLKKQLRRYRPSVSRPAAAAAESDPPTRTFAATRPVRFEETREARETIGTHNQPRPEDFSPIFRSSAVEDEPGPTVVEDVMANVSAPSFETEDVVKTEPADAFAYAAASRGRDGAVPDDEDTQHDYLATETFDDYSQDDDIGATESLPGDLDLGGPVGPTGAAGGHPRPPAPEYDYDEPSKTEMISDLSLGAGGSVEEQELLAELKSIISKKFDR